MVGLCMMQVDKVDLSLRCVFWFFGREGGILLGVYCSFLIGIETFMIHLPR